MSKEKEFEVFEFDIDQIQEGTTFNGEKVNNVQSVIAKIVRTDKEVTVYVPRRN